MEGTDISSWGLSGGGGAGRFTQKLCWEAPEGTVAPRFALEEELVATGPAGHPGHSVSPPHPETVGDGVPNAQLQSSVTT